MSQSVVRAWVGEPVYFYPFEGSRPKLAHVMEASESSPGVTLVTCDLRQVFDGVRHASDPSLQETQTNHREYWDFTPFGQHIRSLERAAEEGRAPTPAMEEKKNSKK